MVDFCALASLVAVPVHIAVRVVPLRIIVASRPAPRVEPISEELRVLRMTVGREFVADLESVR